MIFAKSRLLAGDIAAVEPLLLQAGLAIANPETAVDADSDARSHITVGTRTKTYLDFTPSHIFSVVRITSKTTSLCDFFLSLLR